MFTFRGGGEGLQAGPLVFPGGERRHWKQFPHSHLMTKGNLSSGNLCWACAARDNFHRRGIYSETGFHYGVERNFGYTNFQTFFFSFTNSNLHVILSFCGFSREPTY